MKVPALLAAIWLAALAVPAAAYCPCVANGQLFEQGAVTCLKVPTGEFLARCDTVLNNSSWTWIGDRCPDDSANAAPLGVFEFDEGELHAWDEGTEFGECLARDLRKQS